MVMMMMTRMKLVKSATKFRHGMDKFYQPNSGLRGSKSRDEAIYTHMCIYVYIHIYVYICIYTHICIYVYMYIRIYVYVNIYIYICIYVYMYM